MTSPDSLAAWLLICKPKQKGDLGTIDFHIKNKALLLKLLHKFCTKAVVPWVKLVWSLHSHMLKQNKAPFGGERF
jgi:ubiquinone/menaquinone biosynthesis C-methylase UbiE